MHSGKVEDVLNSSSQLELEADNLQLLQESVMKFDFASDTKLDKGKLIVTLKREVDPSVVNKQLADQGIYVSHISLRKRSLESYFLALLSGNDV